MSRIKGNILAELTVINAAMFIIIRCMDVVATLLDISTISPLHYLQLPSSPAQLIKQPWSLITYMFTHFDVWHITFNMLLMYWFGRIFLTFFNPRQLCGAYIIGGIAGGALYMLAYNTLPYFREGNLMGASASVMTIVFTTAFYRKNYEITLILIGRIKLIYIAAAALILDFISITSGNAGGHIAHIGGAFAGITLSTFLNKGKDITAPLNRIIDRIANLLKPKPKMTVTYRRTDRNYEYNAKRNAEIAEIDAILDKLKQSGYSSLSTDEKKKLFEASKK
jgi:membrane associated rhomboid family serine protease